MNQMVHKSETPYSNLRATWGRYWKAYGGTSAFVSSPYTHFALLLTLLSWQTWTEPEWWDLPLGILPDLLGFTLGGLAVLLGLAEKQVIRVLSFAESPGEPSYLAIIVSSFLHFVIVQGVALIVAMACRSCFIPVNQVPMLPCLLFVLKIDMGSFATVSQLLFWLPCYFVFAYSLMLVPATTMAVFNISEMLEGIVSVRSDDIDDGDGQTITTDKTD